MMHRLKSHLAGSWFLAACFVFVAVGLVTVVTLAVEPATSPPPQPKPVPVMQVLPLPERQASFQREGQELARYHFHANENRPFIYPMIGPAGRSLTRMGHPHDPVSHSHHNSVWISHADVNGVDFWSDHARQQGRIVPQRIEQYEDAGTASWLVALNHWIDPSGAVLIEERRRVQVEPLDGHEWLLTIDLELAAPRSPATFDKTPFGLIGVRMAKTIGVHDGGGRILNSAGGVNEAGVFWKPARWVDYSGSITASATEGITLMDHPQNPNHPSVFHVRDDGWMGASLTFDGPRTVESGQPLHLRYGLYVHSGAPTVEQVQDRWERFAQTEPPASLKKSKSK